MSDLLLARRLALYLLSLLAVASADLAWRAPSALRVIGQAALLSLSQALGTLLADALSGLGAASARRRARGVAFAVFPLPGLFALAVALAAPHIAGQAVRALTLLQLAALLLGEALGVEILVLWGALLLGVVAALAGGPPAVVGLAGFLAVSGAFFSLDHAARRLAAWPRIPAPPVRLVLRDASRLLAVPVVLLAVTVAVLPPPPPEVVAETRRPTLTRPEMQRVTLWLTLVALAGTGGAALVFRWLRGRGDEAPPLIDAMETHVEAEEVLEPESYEDARYGPSRGRVVRAYLRFLARAREAGFRLERHLTPGEIQDRVRRPADPLAVLTDLFLDARYGPDEPSAEAVHRAEAESRAVCAGLRILPRSARRTVETA
jgi:hypothetical protein